MTIRGAQVRVFVVVGAMMGLGLFVLVPQYARAVCVTAPSGLVSWWTGDGQAGDIIGGNDGTLKNGATFAAGKVGLAFSLDGVDDHVLIGNPADLQLQDFTIDAWVKLDTLDFVTPFDPAIFEYGHLGYGFAIARASGFDSSGVGGAGTVVGGRDLFLTRVDHSGVSAGLAITDTNLHHVAVTKSGGTVIFYLDGVAATVPKSYDPGFSFATDAAIGIRTDIGDNPFPGSIDEVEFYNRPLSASEIQAIFNAGSDGKCKPAMIVEIDIRPGQDPNSINCDNPNGVIAVAILTTEDFDAATVDHTTVAFGPDGATEIHTRPQGIVRHEEDVDGDGDIDVNIHFQFGETGLTCEDTEATLTGETFDGTPIQGTDSVRIVP